MMLSYYLSHSISTTHLRLVITNDLQLKGERIIWKVKLNIINQIYNKILI
jgi:hypothetical protein